MNALNRRYERIHSSFFYVLVELASKQHNEAHTELRLIAAIVNSGINDEEYLNSETFWRHCSLLGLTDEFVIHCINSYKRSVLND